MQIIVKADQEFVDSFLQAAKSRDSLVKDIKNSIEFIENFLATRVMKKGWFGYTKQLTKQEMFEQQEKFLQKEHHRVYTGSDCWDELDFSVMYFDDEFYLLSGFVKIGGVEDYLVPSVTQEILNRIETELKLPKFDLDVLGYALSEEELKAYQYFKDTRFRANVNMYLLTTFVCWYNGC